MPKNFDYWGGSPRDAGQAIAAFMQATPQTFAELGRALRSWAESHQGTAAAAMATALGPLREEREKKRLDEQRAYEGQQRTDERLYEREMIGEEREHADIRAGKMGSLQAIQQLLETGVREQGLDAAESAEMMRGLFQQAFPGSGTGFSGAGASGVGIPPGPPGSYLIGQQEDQKYQGLRKGELNLATRPAQGLAGITRHQKPEPWEQQRFKIEEAQRAQERAALDEAISDVTTWALSKEGESLYIPVQMSGLEALGIQPFLTPEERDARIVSMFGQLAPTTQPDGSGQDRSALDAFIKSMSKREPYDVPNQRVFQKGMQGLVKKYGAKAAVEAMKQLEPASGSMAGAAGPRQARDVVRQHILKGLGLVKQAGSPAQVQGSLRDVLGLMEQGQRAADVGAAPQEIALTGEWLGRVGFAMDQIPMEVNVARDWPMKVEGDRFVLQPRNLGDPNGPTEAPSGAQAALDDLMRRNPTLHANALAMSGTPQQQRSPSEAREMGALRKLQGASAPAQQLQPTQPEAKPEAPASEPQSMTEAPVSEGLAALDAFRARVQEELGRAGATPAPKASSKKKPAPRPMPELSELIRLLAVGGGRQ